MRTGDALTALINRTRDTLIAGGYGVCSTSRTAIDPKVPCCTGGDCSTWTITGGIRRHTHIPNGQNKRCSYIPTYVVELVVARCYVEDASLVTDDALGGQAVDVLDCLAPAWGCDAAAALAWIACDFVSAERVQHGQCCGWRILLTGTWYAG